jgi:hypothetical protein
MLMMRDVYAYAFKSDLTLPQIFQRLNDLGPWQWIERDSDRWGEYISARAIARPHEGIAKIFVEPDHYAINVSLSSEALNPQSAFNEVRKFVIERILPAIGARDISEIEDYD